MDSSDTRPPRRRLLWIALGSIALNFFLGGMLIAGFLGGPEGHDRAPLSGLTAAQRTQVDAIHKAHRPTLRTTRREIRSARDAVQDAMTADPFDREALDIAFARLRTRSTHARAAVHAMLVETAAVLPIEAREAMAQRHLHRRRPFRLYPGFYGPPPPPE